MSKLVEYLLNESIHMVNGILFRELEGIENEVEFKNVQHDKRYIYTSTYDGERTIYLQSMSPISHAKGKESFESNDFQNDIDD